MAYSFDRRASTRIDGGIPQEEHRVQERRSESQLPAHGGGHCPILGRTEDLRAIRLPARGRRGVRLLRRPSLRHRAAPLRPFRAQHVKDIVPRYQTMKGYKVERRFGWDCHGLPVEYEMEKELGISAQEADREYGVAKFNEACRSIVLRYTREWRKVITRAGPLGRLRPRLQDHGSRLHGVHLVGHERAVEERASCTRDTTSSRTARAAPPCSPTTSSSLGGYIDVADPAITVRSSSRVRRPPSPPGERLLLPLAWTTTPWTLPVQPRPRAGRDITT